MPAELQHLVLRQSSPEFEQVSETQGAASGVRGPRTSQLQGCQPHSSARAGPGSHEALQDANVEFFAWHRAPASTQQREGPQSCPASAQ
mmetsp:Transcript_13446/g.35539  ORF Transcript_13446/g.35539 Transcript_13446/m.35539 type:complete len:89 (+) Transcript_13446:680-946(+)